MSKMLKIAVGGAVALLLVLAILDILGAVLTSRFVNAEHLERELRAELPPGSSLSQVEEFLRERGIPFSYDGSSRSLIGMVRKVKGSTVLVTKSLQLRFRFDDASRLKSIDSKVRFTGP
jgi:hypothetical protein